MDYNPPLLNPRLNALSQFDEGSVNNEMTPASSICGRGIYAVGGAISQCSAILYLSVQGVFAVLNNISADIPTAGNVFRKLDGYVLRFIEHLGDIKGKLGQFSTFLKHNVAIVDFVQIIVDIDYFASEKFKEKKDENKLRDSNFLIAGHLSFFVADLSGALFWFNEMKLISLSHAAAAIGEIRIFSFVPKIFSSVPALRDFSGLQKAAAVFGDLRVFSFVEKFSCLSVALRAVDLGYALFAIDAGRRWYNADNHYKAVLAGIDLSSYISELVLSAIVFAGVTNIIALGVAGTACISFLLASAAYRISYDKKLKPNLQLTAQTDNLQQEKIQNQIG